MILSIGLIGAYAQAIIVAENQTNQPIKIIAHYKGAIQPAIFELQPGESLSKTDDMGKEKIKYELQVKNPKTGEYEGVLLKKVKHHAAKVMLRAIEKPLDKAPEEEPAYSLEATLS